MQALFLSLVSNDICGFYFSIWFFLPFFGSVLSSVVPPPPSPHLCAVCPPPYPHPHNSPCAGGPLRLVGWPWPSLLGCPLSSLCRDLSVPSGGKASPHLSWSLPSVPHRSAPPHPLVFCMLRTLHELHCEARGGTEERQAGQARGAVCARLGVWCPPPGPDESPFFPSLPPPSFSPHLCSHLSAVSSGPLPALSWLAVFSRPCFFLSVSWSFSLSLCLCL